MRIELEYQDISDGQIAVDYVEEMKMCNVRLDACKTCKACKTCCNGN